MQEKYKNEFIKNDAAEEGTAAHWVSSQLLHGDIITPGEFAPNGIEVDEDMVNYAKDYRDIIDDSNSNDVVEHIEEFISIPDIAEGFGGTPDYWSVNHARSLIRIVDLKYGFNVVEPFENWQMICYVSGIASKLNIPMLLGNYKWTVEIVIYQPRAYHVEGHLRTWSISLCDLIPYIDKLRAAYQQLFLPNPIAVTGSQCKYCEARHVCTTLQQSNYIAIELSQRASALELDINQSGRELLQIEAALEILKARKTGLESQIEFDILTKGVVSPHFMVERAKTREKWQEGKEHFIIALGEMIGKNLAAPAKALTPVQCRKLKVDDEIIKQYSVIPIGENKLIKRNTNLTKKLFGK
jgi:hypothetical protein